jgi:glycosyltransferase involved in cell wall biosynthesis
MKILFISPHKNAYDSKSVRDLPSGGTEKANIFLGEAFQKLGHTVEWITSIPQLEEFVAYGSREYGAVITQEAEFLQLFGPETKKVFWSHHFADQPITRRAAPFARSFADKIVTLSSCHSSDLKALLRLDSVTIGHGVWLGEVQQAEKDPYRLIYASTPFRGLERIPALFRKIKKAESRATIAIASSMATYGDTEGDKQYQSLFDELGQMAGVELLGSLNQQQLYEQYARAGVFYYPCQWKETFCLALEEARAHGCKPLVQAEMGMSDRVMGTFSGEWEAAIGLCFKDSPEFPKQHYSPKDWLEVAKQWEREVFA